jgi:hypothetical protein
MRTIFLAQLETLLFGVGIEGLPGILDCKFALHGL